MTPLERYLAAFAAGTADAGRPPTDVLDSIVFVPLQMQADGSVGLDMAEFSGEKVLLVYSDEQKLEAREPGRRRQAVPLRELVRDLEADVGVFVNPGPAPGLHLPASTLMLLTPRTTIIPEGATVTIGEPDVDPVLLLEELASRFEGAEFIVGGWRCEVVIGEGAEPKLVLGIALQPDTPETRRDALALVARSLRSATKGGHVEVSFDNDGGPYITWMAENSAPFYLAG